MELSGTWTGQFDWVLETISGPTSRMHQQLRDAIPEEVVRKTATEMYNQHTALTAAIANLCKLPRTSSHAVTALLRSLVESLVSILAFCLDPEGRASMYQEFAAVLDFRFACADEKVVGCPYSGKHEEESVRYRKDASRERLRQFGAKFINKKKRPPEEVLAEALADGNEKPKWFRPAWFPENRREILEADRMRLGWIEHALYSRLCCAVHCDVAAAKLLDGLDRNEFALLAFQYWAAGICRLIDTLGLHTPAEFKGVVGGCLRDLQWPPEAKPSSSCP